MPKVGVIIHSLNLYLIIYCYRSLSAVNKIQLIATCYHFDRVINGLILSLTPEINLKKKCPMLFTGMVGE